MILDLTVGVKSNQIEKGGKSVQAKAQDEQKEAMNWWLAKQKQNTLVLLKQKYEAEGSKR